MMRQEPIASSAASMGWSERRADVFIAVAVGCLSPLFLSNNYELAPRLLNLIFFPVGLLLLLTTFRVNWRQSRTLEVSMRLVFTFSVIIAAAFVYLLTMNLSSWKQPGVVLREVDRQWLFAGQIILFMVCIAFAIRTWPKFLPRFVTAFSTLVAASALYNMAVHISAITDLSHLPSLRLINSLGMPGYTNATNISVTYSLLFVASAAIIVDSRLPRLMRLWLVPVALILLTAVALTQSRSAYFGIIVGMMIVLWTAPHAFRRAALISFFAGIVLGAIALLMLSQTRSVVAERGMSYRPEIWKIYADKALQKPLLGYGGLSNIDIRLGNNVVIDQPHNLVLSSQIRGGIFCMLAMITMLVGSLYWSARFLKLRGEVIPLAMIATIATTGMFDYNLLITPATWPWVTFWLPFAICAGAETVVRQCSQQPT